MDVNSTILYVEDDPLSRQVMQMIAECAMGIKKLVVFNDTEDFMARFRALATQPDLILLDVHLMPHSGFDVLAMLRRDPETMNARVVALTASVMNEEVEQLRACGFDGAIGKPLSVTTLPALLERIFQGETVWHIA
jgi:CheY-like chemotaxis protein